MSRIPLLALSVALLLVFQLRVGLAANEYEDASKLFRQGNHSGALAKIETVIAGNPRDARARFLKGLILTEQNKSADAIKIFSALTEDFPELPEPYNNLAVLYASQGQFEKSRKSLEMAIRTHPSYAIAHENLGDVYAKMASEAYDKALQLDSSNAAAQTKLALIKDLFSSESAPGKASPPAKVPVAAAAPEIMDKPTPAPASPAPQSPRADTDAVLAAVTGWAKAWSDKNSDAYLAYYAAAFRVPGGETRAKWEAARRERIGKPASIEVTVGAPAVSFESSERAVVKFLQSYKSDKLSTSGRKILTLVKSNERWQIIEEKMN